MLAKGQSKTLLLTGGVLRVAGTRLVKRGPVRKEFSGWAGKDRSDLTDLTDRTDLWNPTDQTDRTDLLNRTDLLGLALSQPDQFQQSQGVGCRCDAGAHAVIELHRLAS